MAEDLQFMEQGKCTDCRHKFNGRADLSFDITDRDQPPYYSVNVRIICLTCNRRKGKMAKTEYGAFMADQDPWEERMRIKRENQRFGGPLFLGVRTVIFIN